MTVLRQFLIASFLATFFSGNILAVGNSDNKANPNDPLNGSLTMDDPFSILNDSGSVPSLTKKNTKNMVYDVPTENFLTEENIRKMSSPQAVLNSKKIKEAANFENKFEFQKATEILSGAGSSGGDKSDKDNSKNKHKERVNEDLDDIALKISSTQNFGYNLKRVVLCATDMIESNYGGTGSYSSIYYGAWFLQEVQDIAEQYTANSYVPNDEMSTRMFNNMRACDTRRGQIFKAKKMKKTPVLRQDVLDNVIMKNMNSKKFHHELRDAISGDVITKERSYSKEVITIVNHALGLDRTQGQGVATCFHPEIKKVSIIPFYAYRLGLLCMTPLGRVVEYRSNWKLSATISLIFQIGKSGDKKLEPIYIPYADLGDRFHLSYHMKDDTTGIIAGFSKATIEYLDVNSSVARDLEEYRKFARIPVNKPTEPFQIASGLQKTSSRYGALGVLGVARKYVKASLVKSIELGLASGEEKYSVLIAQNPRVRNVLSDLGFITYANSGGSGVPVEGQFRVKPTDDEEEI